VRGLSKGRVYLDHSHKREWFGPIKETGNRKRTKKKWGYTISAKTEARLIFNRPGEGESSSLGDGPHQKGGDQRANGGGEN